jgi:hypothetical protein
VGVSGALQGRRSEQAKAALQSELSESLLSALRTDADVARRLAEFEQRVAAGRLSPAAAADLIVATFLAPQRPG